MPTPPHNEKPRIVTFGAPGVPSAADVVVEAAHHPDAVNLDVDFRGSRIVCPPMIE
jgi:hypothetical protein